MINKDNNFPILQISWKLLGKLNLYFLFILCWYNDFRVQYTTSKLFGLDQHQNKKQLMDNKKMFPLEKISNQIGYLVLTSDGAVLESGGELENDEKSASIIMGLINVSESVDEHFMPKSGCERISIVYDDHSYSICMSNRKIYVIKRKHTNYIPSGESTNGNIIA